GPFVCRRAGPPAPPFAGAPAAAAVSKPGGAAPGSPRGPPPGPRPRCSVPGGGAIVEGATRPAPPRPEASVPLWTQRRREQNHAGPGGDDRAPSGAGRGRHGEIGRASCRERGKGAGEER